MAFRGRFVKLVIGGWPARVRRRRLDARGRRKKEIGGPRSKTPKQEMDMGLLDFVKSAAAKMLGAAETAAAPPAPREQEAARHGRDAAEAAGKTAADNIVLSGSAAAPEEAAKIAPAAADRAAAVQDDLAAAGKAPGAKFYTVRPGDTLWKIAEAEYGHGRGGEYHRIFEANIPLLSDPDQIHPGQVLRIPPLPH
jgi:nucleoid-associated protein YgaU